MIGKSCIGEKPLLLKYAIHSKRKPRIAQYGLLFVISHGALFHVVFLTYGTTAHYEQQKYAYRMGILYSNLTLASYTLN